MTFPAQLEIHVCPHGLLPAPLHHQAAAQIHQKAGPLCTGWEAEGRSRPVHLFYLAYHLFKKWSQPLKKKNLDFWFLFNQLM